MRILYYEATPPHALNAIEFPDDDGARQSWEKWPLPRSMRRHPLQTAMVGIVFPVAIHRPNPGFWLLETRNTVDLRAVIIDPHDLYPALDQERANGGPIYYHFQLTEPDALQWLVMSGCPVPDDILLPQPSSPDPASGTGRPVPAVDKDPIASGDGTATEPEAPAGIAWPIRKRMKRDEAIRKLNEAMQTAAPGLSKYELAKKVGVPRSSTTRYFRKDQGLKNAWQDYERRSTYAR